MISSQLNSTSSSAAVLSKTSFSDLFTQYHRYLFSFALKLTKRKEDAEDLIQETMMRAFRNKSKFEVGTNFKAWSATIMRNTFINGYRKKKRRNMYKEPIDKHAYSLEIDPSYNKGIDELQLEDLKLVLNAIGESYSKPFMLFYKGFQYDEIAEQMNIPIGTVKSRIFFARRKMREGIEKLYGVEKAEIAR